jgi:branched-chain amino acid transport system ATP-binding protein
VISDLTRAIAERVRGREASVGLSPVGQRWPGSHETLRVESLGKKFGGVTALSGLSMELPPGSATAIIGPNGAGKSTALKVIAGVHRPTEGAVFLGNTRLDRLPAYQIPRRGVALAHQVARPFRGLTVHDNVLVAAEAAGVGSGRGRRDHHSYLVLEQVPFPFQDGTIQT